MIANQRQYRITRAEADKFQVALAHLDVVESHRSAPMRQIMRDAMESQIEELREQLADYEALRDGKIGVLEMEGLQELPTALVRARIAVKVTQKELARRLGLKEQQIQRYEATSYRGVSLGRIQEVADALGITIREQVTLPSTAND